MEEAIIELKLFKELAKEWNVPELVDALDMAIEALQADTVSRFHHDMEVKELKHQINDAEPNCKKCAIKELWKETEKEDLVAVARCKDCKHRDEKCGMGEHRWCKILKMSTVPNDFCSYAERREP